MAINGIGTLPSSSKMASNPLFINKEQNMRTSYHTLIITSEKYAANYHEVVIEGHNGQFKAKSIHRDRERRIF